MKNNFKKIISVFLMVTILTGMLPISGMAGMSSLSLKAEAYEDNYIATYPLEIDVTTNKTKYGMLETATISVSVANIGENTVTNMNVMCDFAGLQPVGNPLSLYIDNETLYPNEEISYCFEVVVEKSNLNFFLYLFMLIKSLFTPFAEIPYLDVDDNNCFTSQSFSTLFGNMEIESAIDVWYNYETEIVATATADDFYEETSKLVSSTMNAPDFDIEEAIENPYSMGRVIVQTSGDVDFTEYGADKIITNGNGTTILQLQPSTEMATLHPKV